jgi:hypothetical protein
MNCKNAATERDVVRREIILVRREEERNAMESREMDGFARYLRMSSEAVRSSGAPGESHELPQRRSVSDKEHGMEQAPGGVQCGQRAPPPFIRVNQSDIVIIRWRYSR